MDDKLIKRIEALEKKLESVRQETITAYKKSATLNETIKVLITEIRKLNRK